MGTDSSKVFRAPQQSSIADGGVDSGEFESFRRPAFLRSCRKPDFAGIVPVAGFTSTCRMTDPNRSMSALACTPQLKSGLVTTSQLELNKPHIPCAKKTGRQLATNSEAFWSRSRGWATKSGARTAHVSHHSSNKHAVPASLPQGSLLRNRNPNRSRADPRQQPLPVDLFGFTAKVYVALCRPKRLASGRIQ